MDNQNLIKIWEQVPVDYYETGIAGNIWQRIWHGQKYRSLKQLSNQKRVKVLDVGCASGHLTHYLHLLMPQAQIIGVDVSQKFIAFAQKKYPYLRFIRADAHELPFASQTFDLVLSSEVLEHMVNPQRVLSEIHRCLKKGGELVISTDSGNRLFRLVWHFWITFGPGKVWRGAHLHQLTDQALENLTLANGFTTELKQKKLLGMMTLLKVRKE